MPATIPKSVPPERVGARRAAMLGRPKVDIRLGNASPDVASGTIPSNKEGDPRRPVWWRGRLGYETLSILMADRDVVSIREDAPAISWSDGWAHYAFRPHYAVRRRCGRDYALAIAWARDAVRHRLVSALAHVKPAARRAGYADLELWTDVQTRRPGRLTNADLMFGVAGERFDPSLLEAIRVAAHAVGGPVPIGALRLSCGRPNEGFRAVARLVWDGDLVPTDRLRLIDDDTIVVAASLRP